MAEDNPLLTPRLKYPMKIISANHPPPPHTHTHTHFYTYMNPLSRNPGPAPGMRYHETSTLKSLSTQKIALSENFMLSTFIASGHDISTRTV